MAMTTGGTASGPHRLSRLDSHVLWPHASSPAGNLALPALRYRRVARAGVIGPDRHAEPARTADKAAQLVIVSAGRGLLLGPCLAIPVLGQSRRRARGTECPDRGAIGRRDTGEPSQRAEGRAALTGEA